MKAESTHRPSRPLLAGMLAIGALYVAACASSSSPPPSDAPAVLADKASGPPDPDPRVGLKPGRMNENRIEVLEKAGEASWNLRLLSNSMSPKGFAGQTNSDLAFTGKYVIMGNYNGYTVWDVSNPAKPSLKTSYLCPASQSDVSVYKHLLFVSAEAPSARLDCGTQGDTASVSHDRIRGIRIFDATDISKPKYIANVQTCRGSHTHTVVSDPKDSNNVYIYVSGSSSVRSSLELAGCSNLSPDQDPNSARFRIEVIQVPLAAPQNARIVTSPRIFNDLAAAPRRTEPAAAVGGGGGRGGRGGGGSGGGADVPASPRTGPDQCHDITVYPAVGLAGGACRGYGLLLDISDVKNPRRIYAAADTNMAMWHSATFSNDGSKVLFSDEWGGGRGARCRATDRPEWGANALFTIENREMKFKGYYKLPAAQSEQENCVAHNGSLIPIPGREVMVQGWYQGGVSVFDWTDPSKATEIAFFDRGPLTPDRLLSGGSWSAYWFNGYIYSAEIARGLDVFELQPSAYLTQNEIDAAKTVILPEMNAQEQPQFVWPPSFALARAFVDQLQRSNGLTLDRLTAVRGALASAERANGQRRRDALTQLASSLDADAARSSDQAKVRMLVSAVRDLAR